MWNQDLSLGIDISDQHISAVLLSRHRDKISVVKAVHQRLAASAFGGDDTKTAQKIGRTIRQLLLKAGIRQKKAWVSFGLERLLLQIVDIPEQLPGNLGQYIRRQIRNNPLLNSKNPCLDFASMTKEGAQCSQQCFVAAIDPQPIETLIKAMGVASLNPQVIDIPITSLCRALYKKHLSQGYKHHTLLFYLHGQDVYLAVLRKANLDYIRHLERITDKDALAFEQRAIEQIRAVIQYYEMEFMAGGEEECSWQFILASESHSEEMEKLKEDVKKLFGQNLVYLSDKTAVSWLPIETSPQIKNLPLGATGAALRKWSGFGLKTEIDLLPEQTRKKHFVIEYFINTSRIAAAVFLLIMLLAYGLDVRVDKVRSKSRGNSAATPQENIEQLLAEEADLEEQLDRINKQKTQTEAIMGGYSIKTIAGLLDQIRQCTPAAVCMTQIGTLSKGTVEIKGYCPTMEEIQNFARLLETAAYVKTAQIRQSEIYSKNRDWRSFLIICTLKERI